MRDSKAAANGEVAGPPGQRVEEMELLPIGAVRKAEPWVDVAAAAKPVVDQIIALLRGLDVLVSRADVQHQAIGRAPVILRVDVLFLQTIVQ